MLTDEHSYFIDDELYLENFENKCIKIFNLDTNCDIMSDDTMYAINGIISMDDYKAILDLSGLLLEGTFNIKNIANACQKKIIKKLDCSNNYFDTIIGYNPNIVIYDFVFDENPIKKIYFPDSFNKNIDFLPCTLKVLIFPTNSVFDKPINDLPISLEVLSTGNSFNQTINNLPKNLIHLMLGSKFNQPIKKLPQYLKTLIFNNLNTYGYELNCIPNSLENLYLPLNYNNLIPLPDKYKFIKFTSTIDTSNSNCKEFKKNLEKKGYSFITIQNKIMLSNCKFEQIIYYK